MELTEEMVVRFAQEYVRKHGRLPSQRSGLSESAATWGAIDAALRRKRGTSLSRLLRPGKADPLAPAAILLWARAYKQKRGKYPSQLSGTECLPKGLTWAAINSALVNGYKGLPGGQSLSQLVQSLKEEDRVANAIDEFADFIRRIDPVQASRTRIIAKLRRLRRLLDGSTDEMDEH